MPSACALRLPTPMLLASTAGGLGRASARSRDGRAQLIRLCARRGPCGACLEASPVVERERERRAVCRVRCKGAERVRAAHSALIALACCADQIKKAPTCRASKCHDTSRASLQGRVCSPAFLPARGEPCVWWPGRLRWKPTTMAERHGTFRQGGDRQTETPNDQHTGRRRSNPSFELTHNNNNNEDDDNAPTHSHPRGHTRSTEAGKHETGRQQQEKKQKENRLAEPRCSPFSPGAAGTGAWGT